MASFAERNPNRKHIVFDEVSAEAFIAARFSARELAAFRACRLPAMQADYLRYCAVLALGGMYADADFRCVADCKTLIENTEGTLFGRRGPVQPSVLEAFGWSQSAVADFKVGEYLNLGNSLFAFRRQGHPLLALTVEIATANVEHRVADGGIGVWLTTGPGIFTSMYLLQQLGSFDLFLAHTENTPLWASARLFCEVVGDCARVVDAMAEVVILPRETAAADWIAPIEKPSQEEGAAPHWLATEGSIFR